MIGGHFSGDVVSVFRNIFVPIGCVNIVPHVRPNVVLRDAFAKIVPSGGIVLSISITFKGGFLEPSLFCSSIVVTDLAHE